MQAFVKTSFPVECLGYRVHLGAGEEPRVPALAPLCALNKGVRSLGHSSPISTGRGLTEGLCPFLALRPPWQTHTSPYPWIQPQLPGMLLKAF